MEKNCWNLCLRMEYENATPIVYAAKKRTHRDEVGSFDADTNDPIDALEIFDYIRDINDPEHPYTLEELNVVGEDLIKIGYFPDEEEHQQNLEYVDVSFTPTIPHCSMATLIGLAIYVKLYRSLHPSVKVYFCCYSTKIYECFSCFHRLSFE